MNKPTEAQVKEFWEWCGIEPDLTHIPANSWTSGGGEWMYPSIDLNNLFQYAVPKVKAYCLQSLGEEHKLHHASVVLDYEPDKWNEMKVFSHNVDRGEDPALALFWALWQVKENSK